MKRWERALIEPSASLRDALRNIDATGAGIALVADGGRRLLGTLSDGDIRRALIRGADLDGPCGPEANRDPATAPVTADAAALLGMLRSRRLRQLPVVDGEGRVAGLVTVGDFLDLPERDNAVVIMAGGRGRRLEDLTRDTPKPMIRVGSRPMLDTVVDAFAAQGFRRLWLSVNYLAEQIEEHFKDGAERGLHIRYLREDRPLGTCGALSLLPRDVDCPLIVTNADVLTKMDYGALLDAHEASGAAATVVVRDYEMQVPFGVVEMNGELVADILEKPSRRFSINAGVYVLSKAALDTVPADRFFDMPDLLRELMATGGGVASHRADGYWVDVGRPADLARANAEFSEVFER